MADTIKVSIDCFAPHEKSPDFIKGTTTFILSNEDFDLIEKYKRACNGNGKENFIPVQIKETKSGKNMIFLDTYKLNFQIQQEENGNNEVANAPGNQIPKKSIGSIEEDIDIDSIPF